MSQRLTHKICTHCGKKQPATCFEKLGLMRRRLCRVCFPKYAKRIWGNSEKVLQSRKKWVQANINKVRSYKQKWRANNQDRIKKTEAERKKRLVVAKICQLRESVLPVSAEALVQKSAYRQKQRYRICKYCKKEKLIHHFEKPNKWYRFICRICQPLQKHIINDDILDWRRRNRDKVNAYNKKYRDAHKQQSLEYQKKRRDRDPNYKIRINLTHRIWTALHKNKKLDHTINLLGCSINQLRRHLEQQFLEGMSWSNYGTKGWVVDHIVPCRAFDLSTLSGQQSCFHYSNLRPMWSRDNNIKSDRLPNGKRARVVYRDRWICL